MTRHLVAPLLGLGVLAGCAASDDAWVVRHCLDFGLYPDTPEYIQCLTEAKHSIEYNRQLRQQHKNPL